MSSVSKQIQSLEFAVEAIESFYTIPDPRTGNNRWHLIGDIVIIAICSILCGARGWLGIEAIAKSKKKWFQKFLLLPNGIPSHDTYSRIFAVLDPQILQERLAQWASEMHRLVEGSTVAIDGKALKRSFNRASGTKAIHQVTAWACEEGIALAATKVASKSNEITAIPDVLDMLHIPKCVVSIDAIGCQKAIASKIRDKGADYVLAVKKNQLNLYLQVEMLMEQYKRGTENSACTGYYQTTGKTHGREEQRRYWITNQIDSIKGKEEWMDLQSVGCVESTRVINGKKTVEVRYYISSRAPIAKAFARSVRGHWGIENNLHWVLDVGMGSDYIRMWIGNSAINFSILQTLALSLLKKEKSAKCGIQTKQILCASNEKYLEKVLKYL
jgi:predicted transposase YbfD/YdcC